MDTIKGRFVVIEGGDGSGKGTQSRMIMEYLQKNAVPAAYLDFPDYNSFFGKLIAKFLRGELGNLNEISPYLASLPFALDRNAVKDKIQAYLDEGKMVIANRYVSSNLAHQSSKLVNEPERLEFLTWLETLEYEIHKIPKPDLTIFLYMPWQKAKELTTHKEERSYLNGGKVDIQEADDKHREETEKMYLLLANRDSSWKTIQCVEHDTIVSKERIFDKVIDLLQKERIL